MFAKALALVVVVGLQLVSAQSCSRSYTVQSGDICDGISAQQNVSTYQLAVVNTGVIDSACDNLQPGSTICLGWVNEDCTSTHTVQPNDDCEIVASTYGTNLTILYANNPQLDADCTNLYIGEVVCVASSVAVPPMPSSGVIPATSIPSTAYPANPTLPYCD